MGTAAAIYAWMQIFLVVLTCALVAILILLAWQGYLLLNRQSELLETRFPTEMKKIQNNHWKEFLGD